MTPLFYPPILVIKNAEACDSKNPTDHVLSHHFSKNLPFTHTAYACSIEWCSSRLDDPIPNVQIQATKNNTMNVLDYNTCVFF